MTEVEWDSAPGAMYTRAVPRIALQPASHDERCLYCRDALDGSGVRCGGCAAGYHAPCARELGRCGTLGCARPLSGRRVEPLRSRAGAQEELPARVDLAPARAGAPQDGLTQGELILLLLVPFLVAARAHATFEVPDSFAGLAAAALSLLGSVPLTLLGLGLARLRGVPREQRRERAHDAALVGSFTGVFLSVLVPAVAGAQRFGGEPLPFTKATLLAGAGFAVGCCLAAAWVLFGALEGEPGQPGEAGASSGAVRRARRARRVRWRRRRR